MTCWSQPELKHTSCKTDSSNISLVIFVTDWQSQTLNPSELKGERPVEVSQSWNTPHVKLTQALLAWSFLWLTDKPRHSTWANSKVSDLSKSELIHTSWGSESSNISLVVLVKEYLSPLPSEWFCLHYPLRADMQVLIHRMTLENSNYYPLYNLDSIGPWAVSIMQKPMTNKSYKRKFMQSIVAPSIYVLVYFD